MALRSHSRARNMLNASLVTKFLNLSLPAYLKTRLSCLRQPRSEEWSPFCAEGRDRALALRDTSCSLYFGKELSAVDREFHQWGVGYFRFRRDGDRRSSHRERPFELGWK